MADKTGTPDDSFCKIAAFRHQFIFVSVGSARFAKTDINHPVKSWDNAEVAGEAIRNMLLALPELEGQRSPLV